MGVLSGNSSLTAVDLDDVSTHVRQNASGEGSCQHVGEVENLDTAERLASGSVKVALIYLPPLPIYPRSEGLYGLRLWLVGL